MVNPSLRNTVRRDVLLVAHKRAPDLAATWLEETLVSLKWKTSVLMVSHDAAQVKRIADGVTVLG